MTKRAIIIMFKIDGYYYVVLIIVVVLIAMTSTS